MGSLQPTGDRLLLQRLAPESQQRGSIVIPDSAVTQNQKFKVLAVGPGKVVNGVRAPMDVAVGDIVLLGQYAGASLEVNGIPVFLAAQDEVLAVIG